jgi:hypothetical protein
MSLTYLNSSMILQPAQLATLSAVNVTVYGELSALHQNYQPIADCFYVATFGSDDGLGAQDTANGRGRNEQIPYASIKYAASKIAAARANGDTNPYTIFVRSGSYTEQNPIYLPPNTSVIGDNLRRVSITPANPTLDIFWVDSACYIWGMTFRGHKTPSAAVAFPLWANTTTSQSNSGLNPTAFTKAYYNPSTLVTPPSARPYIYVSPYTQGCTSYATSTGNPNNGGDAGCGMRIDGSLVDGNLRSMVIDSFTQVNQGGRGIHLLNHGYAQFVSTFTVACTDGIVCESGATCSISTSNSTFGLSGLVARGKSTSPILSGVFAGFTPGTNTFAISGVTPLAIPLSGNDKQYVAQVPYPGTCFTVSNLAISAINPIAASTAGYDSSQLNLFFVNQPLSAVNDANKTWVVTLDYNIGTNLKSYFGKPVNFYARSTIETSSHTFEYMGCGTYILSAVPAQGGQVNNANEVVFDGQQDPFGNAPGIVYYTSSNEKGNFNVGPNFQIVQSTGTITGQTFQRSILTLVTPLTIALE